MNVYCVITMISDEKYAQFLKNLNIYHGCVFPLCKKAQIYKVINRDMCIVRAEEHWSTGDVLGFLSTEIELSDEDRLYCLPLPNSGHNIRHNHYYLDAILDNLDEQAVVNSKQKMGDIFYLANYLHMLEKDEVERERKIPFGIQTIINIFIFGDWLLISDRFQHWTTNSRFRFDDIENLIRPVTKILGFDQVFLCRDGELVGEINEDNFFEVNEDNFNETELMFLWVKDYDWKEKLDFDLDGETSARTIQNGKWERITRKPS